MEPRFKFSFARQPLSHMAFILWVGASCAGLVVLALYDSLPGDHRLAPLRWPADSRIALNEQGATLVVFAHPHCPCTGATLGELEKIVARCQKSVATWVVFFRPLESDVSWDQSDLTRIAGTIPSVRILSDQDGVEARRFHATTSGQALLYDRHGSLLFDGGITLARGHAGDNLGRSEIESYLIEGTLPSRQTPVYGCPIALTPDDK